MHGHNLTCALFCPGIKWARPILYWDTALFVPGYSPISDWAQDGPSTLLCTWFMLAASMCWLVPEFHQIKTLCLTANPASSQSIYICTNTKRSAQQRTSCITKSQNLHIEYRYLKTEVVIYHTTHKGHKTWHWALLRKTRKTILQQAKDLFSV